MATPSYREFVAMHRNFDLIPVYTRYQFKNENPLSFYSKIRSISTKEHSFLLESVEGTESNKRYSFIGFNPFLIYKSKNNKGIVFNEKQKYTKDGTPTKVLSTILKSYSVPEMPQLPPFFGGGTGYFSYDTVRSLEKLPDSQEDSLNLPDCYFIFPGDVIVFDHLEEFIYFITLVQPENEPEKSYSNALARLDFIIETVFEEEPAETSTNQEPDGTPEVSTNISADRYFNNVRKAVDYIRKGDILQVVLSRRYCTQFNGDSLKVFKNLRQLNPSPYMFYLDFGDPVVLGASPEMLVRVQGNTAETRPIAGTRPRYNNHLKDRQMAKDLLEDEKERAEHLMLVDLGRNDLGRECIPGSISVPQFMEVEKFSHVMHLVSQVKGELESNKQSLQVLESCFPAGTVSGAPKIRAMEIIDELETDRRGIYAGAVGYAAFGGDLDTAIAIRTMVITGGKAYIQAGGGIVADSEPENEYQETVRKAMGLLQVLGIKESGGINYGTGNR